MAKVFIHPMGFHCHFEEATYDHGNRIALKMIAADSHMDCLPGEVVGVASVNMPHIPLEEDQVLIKDYSEGQGMLEALTQAGIVTPTGAAVPSGFVTLPIVTLNRETFKEYCL